MGVINMAHNDALIINAMLASYASEENKGYIELIEPFILYSLPKKKNTIIDISYICSYICDNFGIINVQKKVIEKILINLSNKKEGYVITKKERATYTFYVGKPVNTKDFDNRKKEMQSLVNDVVLSLKTFANDNIIKKISVDDAKSLFINFLKKYNAESYNSIENIEQIKLKENFSSGNHLVARFILNEYQSELGCFDKIKQIQEGYFASVALYYFFNDIEINNNNNALHETCVFLDTMLLVDSLQINTEYKAKSMEELLTLIVSNGGSLYTFDYYFDELCGIITKYLNDPKSRIYLDLEKFRRENTNTSKIVLYLKKLQDEKEFHGSITLPFNNIKIKVISQSSYDDLVELQNWHINVNELEQSILSHVKYSDGKNDIGFHNDFNSIENILYDKLVEKSKSIFISSNINLIFAATSCFQKYQLFYTDIDITSMLWLSNYQPNSNLSELTLLQNAYAALNPSKEVLDEAIKIIDQNLNSSDQDLKNEALLLRYDSNLLYYISSVTENNKNNIKNDFHDKLMTCLHDKVRNDVESENKELIDEIRKNKKKLSQINAAINIQKDTCKFWAKVISSFLTLILSLVAYSIIFVITYVLLQTCFKSIIKEDNVNNIFQIINLFCFALSLVPFFIKRFKIIKKLHRILNEYFIDLFFTHSKLINMKDTD